MEPTRAPVQRLADEQARRARLTGQRLAVPLDYSAGAVAELVRVLVGVQVQETAAARLALRARCRGLSGADVEEARVGRRSVVRTWCQRGTLHLVASTDLGWLLALLGPPAIRAGRRRRAELGLDDETAARGVRAMRDVLRRHGPLTRAEIAGHLASLGIPTAGQAKIHLIGLAGLQGVLCYGPDRGGEPTFVALEDWLDVEPTLPPEVAPAELARRYLAAYGPAGLEDFATWSGLPMGLARAGWQALAGRLHEVEVQGRAAWLLDENAGRLDQALAAVPAVRLVPGFDPYLLGYRGRRLAVDAEHEKRIHPGGGLLHPTLLVDGRAAGTWRLKRRRGRAEVDVEAFEELAGVRPELEAEIEDVIRFCG